MNPLIFGLIFLGSWLLIGLGLFLVFRSVVELKRETGRGTEAHLATVTPNGPGRGIMAAALLAGFGIIYAGGYTLLNLLFRS